MSVRVGIDGGQSGLRVRVVGSDVVRAPRTVSHADRDLVAAYAASLRGVLPEGTGPVERVVAGLSALPADDGGRQALAAVIGSTLDAAEAWLCDDATTSHRAAFDGGAGVVLVAGTGVACLALDADGGPPVHVDGAGPLVDDDGGAFGLGSAGLRAAVRSHDGRGPATSLLDRACQEYACVPTDLADAVHRHPRPVTAVAAFARVVLAESAHDAEADGAVRDAAAGLVRTTLTGLRHAGDAVRVALGGRLLAAGSAVRTAYLAAVTAAGVTPDRVVDGPAPLDGACAFAGDADPGRYAPLVRRVGRGTPYPTGTAGRLYLDLVAGVLAEAAETNRASIDAAAEAVARCVAGGGLVHTFGTGHSHLLAEELFYRAGGLAAVDPILVEPLMLHAGAFASTEQERRAGYAEQILADRSVSPGDVLVVASNSGGNRVSIELASLASQRGAVVVALTSRAHATSPIARASSEPRLHELADIVLDNGGVPGDAAVTVPGLTTAVGPTSTVLGAALLQAVVTEAVARLVARGVDPGVFRSANTDGGDEANAALLARYTARVRSL